MVNLLCVENYWGSQLLMSRHLWTLYIKHINKIKGVLGA